MGDENNTNVIAAVREEGTGNRQQATGRYDRLFSERCFYFCWGSPLQ